MYAVSSSHRQNLFRFHTGEGFLEVVSCIVKFYLIYPRFEYFEIAIYCIMYPPCTSVYYVIMLYLISSRRRYSHCSLLFQASLMSQYVVRILSSYMFQNSSKSQFIVSCIVYFVTYDHVSLILHLAIFQTSDVLIVSCILSRCLKRLSDKLKRLS